MPSSPLSRRTVRACLRPLRLVALATALTCVVGSANAHAAGWYQTGTVGTPGAASTSTLSAVGGIAVLDDGTYVISDFGDAGAIRHYSRTGALLGRWNGVGGVGNPLAATTDVATGPGNTIYALDIGTQSVHVFDATGAQVDEFGTGGSGDGEFSSFSYGIGVSASGETWVADTGASRIARFDANGDPLPSIDAGGSALGELSTPADVAFLADGTAWVADAGNMRLQRFAADGASAIEAIDNAQLDPDTDGIVRVAVRPDGTLALSEQTPGPGALPSSMHLRVVDPATGASALLETGIGFDEPGEFYAALGLAVDADGSIVVGDQTGRLQRFHRTAGGALGTAGAIDVVIASRLPRTGSFISPTGVGVASDGAVAVTDDRAQRVTVFNADGSVRFIAPSLTNQVNFNGVSAVVSGGDGTWWVADTFNNRVVHLDAGGVEVASWGSYGAGDQEVSSPRALALDVDGDHLLVSDADNKRIQVLDVTGAPTSVDRFGTAGYGPGLLDNVHALSISASGDLYVADRWQTRVNVFERTAPALPGDPPTFTYDRAFGQWGEQLGQFHQVTGMTTLADGSLLLMDQELARMQRLDPVTGTFSELHGTPGTRVDEWFRPWALAAAPDGTVLATDNGNARVVRLTSGTRPVDATPDPDPIGGGSGTSSVPDVTAPVGAVTSISAGNGRAAWQSKPSSTAFVNTRRDGSILIEGAASDAGSGVVAVVVPDLDGSAGRVLPAGIRVNPVGGRWQALVSWRSGAKIAGEHTLVIVDAAGNTSTTTITLVADRSAPRIVLPTSSTTRSSTVVLRVVDGAGSGATVSSVTIRPKLGRHAYRVRMVDRVGNVRVVRVTLRRVR